MWYFKYKHVILKCFVFVEHKIFQEREWITVPCFFFPQKINYLCLLNSLHVIRCLIYLFTYICNMVVHCSIFRYTSIQTRMSDYMEHLFFHRYHWRRGIFQKKLKSTVIRYTIAWFNLIYTLTLHNRNKDIKSLFISQIH